MKSNSFFYTKYVAAIILTLVSMVALSSVFRPTANSLENLLPETISDEETSSESDEFSTENVVEKTIDEPEETSEKESEPEAEEELEEEPEEEPENSYEEEEEEEEEPYYDPIKLRISNVSIVDTPAVDAGNGVKRYKDLLYGHSTLAFNPVKNLYEGDLITVTENGTTSTYKIARREVFNREDELDGNANKYFRARLYEAKYADNEARKVLETHDIALMTCGNGSNNDSNYRLVLWADKIA